MKETNGARDFLLATVAVTLLLASSCSEGNPTYVRRADLCGTWVPDEYSRQHWIKNSEDRTRCRIVLQADGTFTATVPDYMLDTSDRCGGRVRAGRGTWSVGTESVGSRLELWFSDLDGKACNMGAKWLYFEPPGKLTFGIDEPDSVYQFAFEKVHGARKRRS
jgi:hypothetical protein